jgi:hypothetical protein
LSDVQPSSADLSASPPVVVPAARSAGEPAASLISAAELTLAVLSFAAGGYIFATTVLMVVDAWTAVPFWDQWWTGIFAADQPFLSWLFLQNNEHRIAVPRLLFIVDEFLFDASNKFTLGFNIVSQLSLAVLIIYMSGLSAGQTIREKIWLVGAVLSLLFSAMQFENFLWGFQVSFAGVALAAMATFATLVLGRPRAATLIAVIGLESIAVYTLASGVLVPFLAILLALWLRWPKGYIMVLGVVALGLLASYLYGYVSPPHHSDPIQSIGQLRGLFSYLLTTIGLPFGTVFNEAHVPRLRNWDRLCGAAGIALLAVAAISMLRRRERSGPIPVLVAAALFVLGMALLTALGRLKFGAAQAMSSKYSTGVLLFWLSLMVIAIIRLRRQNAHLRVAAKAAFLPLLLGLAYYQSSFAATGRNWVLPRLEATTALLAKVEDPTALGFIFFDPALKIRVPFLRDRHLSIFADRWSDWLGTPLGDHARLVDPVRCRGGIDGIDAVGAADPHGWRARGWVWDPSERSTPRRIVIADPSGLVLGYGLSGFPRTGEGGDWRGHFAMGPPASIIAYALLENGRSACPLGRWPLAPQ